MRNLLYILILIFWSCQNGSSIKEPMVKKSEMNLIKKHPSALALAHISKNKITIWEEYQKVTNSLHRFSSISASEALNNALKLSEEIKSLKDSIRPKELLNPSFKSRINVLENEALRLKDMTFIPAITANEVHTQVNKIIDAFSATNSKINTTYSQLQVELDINKNQTTNSLKQKL